MNRKILVIDDELGNIQILRYRLESNGYKVLGASNGQAGIARASEETPDLILLDVMMPNMNGFEVCKRIRLDPKTKDIPVIMLTALSAERDMTRGLADGANCFISKPYNPSDLLKEIEDVITAA